MKSGIPAPTGIELARQLGCEVTKSFDQLNTASIIKASGPGFSGL
jgi:hypothetical protein